KPANDALLGLSGDALDHFEQRVQAIAAHEADAWRSQPFRASAEAYREQGTWVQLRTTPSAFAPLTPDAPQTEAAPLAPAFAADVQAPAEPAPAADEAVPMLADIDFASLAAVSAPAEPAAADATEAGQDAATGAD